jgi:hypothetical protein
MDTLVDNAWRSCSATAQHARFADKFYSDNAWRERFQLLTAALIYSRRALLGLQSGGLHVTADPAATPAAWTEILGRNLNELSALEGPAFAEIRAGMDSASSSFRIATARQGRWPSRDDVLLRHLKNAASTVRCRETGPADPFEDDECLAVIVAHRDSFGHGEEGDGTKPWRKERQKHFSKMCQCRVVEAQLRQIRLGFNELLAAL